MTHTADDAMAAFRAGDIDHAGVICAGILARSPADADATYVSGLIKYQRNEIKAAIETLVRAIALDPSSAGYHRSLASIFKNIGATEIAVRFFRQADRLDPDHVRTNFLLAEALMERGDLEPALEHYRQGYRHDPSDAKIQSLIDKLEMVITVSRAMLQKRDTGRPVTCDLGDQRFGHHVVLRLPQSSIDYAQAYKSNLDARADAYNARGLDGAFGAKGAIMPHYLAAWIYADYLSMRDYLPQNASDILDIGCGFGGLSVLLNFHYAPTSKPRFHLVDQARVPGAEFSRPTPDAPDLDPLACATELLIANGVDDTRIHATTSENATGLSQLEFDLIVSIRSWCFLYPIETYIDVARNALRPGGRLLVDVHKKLGGLAALREFLPNATLVSESHDLVRCLAVKDP